jgi:murein DD-endopeptidase MepM/ murein hydrolase activator NlpD
MRYKFAYPVSGRLSSVLAITLLASVSSACSTGVTRFNENPFSNPFQARYDQTTTGSIKKAALKPQTQGFTSPKLAAPTYSSKISSSPLPAPGSTQAKLMMAGATSSASSKMTVAKSIPGWSAKGATPVTLGAGESVETVANRYGVPPSALLSVNGLSNSSQAVPGQRLLIPAYNATSGAGLSGAGLPNVGSGMSGASGAAGAAKKLGVKSLSSLDLNPLKIKFNQTYYAFSDLDKTQDQEAIDPAKFLGFAPVEKLEKTGIKKAVSVQKTPVVAPAPAVLKKVRAVSNIAAPISVKAPKSVAVAKPAPVKAEPVKLATKPQVKVDAKPKILAAAPKKLQIRTVAAKPSIAVAAKPVKQVADNPATTSKVIAKAKPAVKIVEKATPKPKIATAAKPVVKAKPLQAKVAVQPKVAAKVTEAKVTAPKSTVSKTKQVAIVAGVAGVGAVAASKSKLNDADVKKVEAAPINGDTLSTGSLPPTLEAANNEDKGLFRWPVRGRVISGFGAKELSGTNNGINIAVPDGTPVKAAEVGTVAYAGDDVKKYGKLVLIKHENGYVSAYAHNGELNVKKGDMVKRGQVIAKSGATGDVASPQLHFQLRKGEQPMDPAKLLDAG